MTYAADQVQVASSGGNVVIKEGQTPVSETPSVTDIDETKLSCDHEWSTTVETAATCAGTGSEHHECSKCHLSYDVTLAKDSNNHTEINDQGYCLGCDKHFSESYMISQGYICKTLKWTNGGEYNGHTYEREYIKTYHKTLESAQAAIAIGSDSLTEERTVYIIADTDQDIEITAKQVVIVNSGVNYTGTVTKPNEVEITSAVKCYAGSFTTAWSIASRLYTSTNNQVTLKLLGDCDVKGTLMTASGSKINLTVDLNGHNINYSGSSQLFQISSGCEMFKVTSSSTKGTINLGNKQLVLAYAAIEFNNVDINVTGNLSNNLVLTYSGSSFGVGLDNVNINIENMSSNVFCVYGALYLGEKCNINITGYLNSSLLSINSADSGSSGYKGYNGISIKGTTINVNEFKANSPFLSRNAGTAFELENATITLGNTDKEFINRLDGSATVVISGGTFSGFKTVSYGDCGKVITGGTWSCDPTKAVADGYHVVDNGNSTWSVVAD